MQVKVIPPCFCLPTMFWFAIILYGGSCTSSSVASAGAAVNGGLLEIKDVILDFIQRKPITLSTIYYCNPEDAVLFEIFNSRGWRVNGVDLRRVGLKRQPRPAIDIDLLRIGFIVDMRCKEIIPLLNASPDFFQPQQIYVLHVESGLIDNLLPVLRVQNGVRMDSDITILATNGSIYDCYKIANSRNVGARMMIHENGHWTDQWISPYFNANTYKLPSRTNLTGLVVDCVIYLNPLLQEDRRPWTDYLEKRLDTTHDSTLYHLQLLYMLMRKFNFDIRIRKTNTWSASTPGENVTGELGFLDRHQAVFMITPYRMTLDRLHYGDFTTITWEPWFVFMFRHPKSTSIHSKYLVPFQWSVWLTILTTLLLFVSILAVHLKRSKSFETVPDRSLVEVCVWLTGYLCQQYNGHFPNLNSSRVLTTSIILMSFLSYQYYCTFIIASLITESPKTIKTLDDLLQTGMEIGTTRAVYTRDLFFSVPDPRMAYIYDEMIEKRGTKMDVDEAVRRIKRGNFAFHHDQDALYGVIRKSLNQHEICDLASVSFFRPFPAGMQVEKGSAYRELFILGLQPIVESGVAKVERLNYFPTKPACVKSQVEVVPVAFDTITVPLLVMLSGIFASLIVLGVEMLWHRWVSNWKMMKAWK